ncbi:hypothetical protein P8452_52204 [Trifolium repens]|nr:hypothetical protein P8452_52204 [Trifolium repens]
MKSLIRIEALVPLPPTENTKRHGRFNRHAFFNPTTKSILKDEWKEIGKDVKDKIWEDLESYFVIPVIDPDPDKDPLRIKECYLAPYLVPKHWKLIIMCPKDNIIVCLCSLHQKVDEATKKYFTDAFMVHQFACGNRKRPTWIFSKTRVQPNGNDCGYYVMKNMIDIVSASVTKKWDEVFNDPTALSEDDLYELRNRWATCFLDLYNPEKDYDDGDDDGAKGR